MSDSKSPDTKSAEQQSTEEEIDFDEISAKYAHQPDAAQESEFSTIPVRNPKNDEFFRVHPDEEFTKVINVIQYKTENEFYLIKESVRQQLGYESCFKVMKLYTC